MLHSFPDIYCFLFCTNLLSFFTFISFLWISLLRMIQVTVPESKASWISHVHVNKRAAVSSQDDFFFFISQRGTAFYCLDSYLLMMFDGIRQWLLQVFISPDDNDEDEEDDDDDEGSKPRTQLHVSPGLVEPVASHVEVVSSWCCFRKFSNNFPEIMVKLEMYFPVLGWKKTTLLLLL